MRLHTVRCMCNNNEKDDYHNSCSSATIHNSNHNSSVNSDNNDINDNNNNSNNNNNNNYNNDNKNNDNNNNINNNNDNNNSVISNFTSDGNISTKVKNNLKKIPQIIPHESLAVSTIAVQQSFSQAENFRKLWENFR